MTTLFGESTSRLDASAEISDCGRYRWWLRRSWQFFRDGQGVPGNGVCSFIMLNPSTADGRVDDPTIRRCIGFAKSWGYDTLSVRNLFPWRATDPAELGAIDSNIATGGSRGDAELLAALTADRVIVAWGANVPHCRDANVLAMFRRAFPAVPLYCLGLTAEGKPRHPLYVRAATQPQLFEARAN